MTGVKPLETLLVTFQQKVQGDVRPPAGVWMPCIGSMGHPYKKGLCDHDFSAFQAPFVRTAVLRSQYKDVSKESKHRRTNMTHDSVYATGQRVGDYRLLRQLGAGGFADVYLAEPLYEDGQPVAIKLLTHLLGHTDGLHAFMTFIQEARMIHLKHPHIVPVQDFGISREGIPYLVMEYVSGGTLRQRHPKGTPVPLPTVLGYVRPLAAALQYLHDHRLLHCDVMQEESQGEHQVSDQKDHNNHGPSTRLPSLGE